MAIQFKTTDYKLSTYTGLTRDSWIEAGKYLLEGVFQNVPDINTPIVVKRYETKITYPHLDDPLEKQIVQRRAERFEGLIRSFYIAAPLIRDNPEVEVRGILLKDYYKNHILRCCDKNDKLYIGDYEFLKNSGMNPDPYPKFQQTVECSAMVIGLWFTKEHIWDTYSKKEQDIIADYLKSFAYGATHDDNWNLFNMLILAFLNIAGYEIDRAKMLDFAYRTLSYHAGDGWYRDGLGFDYYTAMAFNLYAPLWNVWYGYDNEPQVANRFEEISNKLMETYANMFDKDAFVNMWGRSIIYRNGCTAAFAGNAFLKNPGLDYGLARRVMSGALKQFLTRDDFLRDGIPTLGFYGSFSYLLQGYSCAASPYWLAKPFLSLYFDKDHPLWGETENNGIWEKLNENEVKQTILNGPAICITNHGGNGETIFRTGKVIKGKDYISEIWNYAKLAYNSKYPWEATPVSCPDVDTQQYTLVDKVNGNIHHANLTFWIGEKKGVLYRKQFFDYRSEEDMQRTHSIKLADVPVKYGILRFDRPRMYRWPMSITLGAYGFTDNGTKITKIEKDGAKAIILKGKDYTGQEKQLAMTIYDGWESIEYTKSHGTNPDSENSIVIYARTELDKSNDGEAKAIFISQTITKESHESFSEEEIFPIEKIEYSDRLKTGAYGDIKITLKDKTIKTINFDELEGELLL